MRKIQFIHSFIHSFTHSFKILFDQLIVSSLSIIKHSTIFHLLGLREEVVSATDQFCLATTMFLSFPESMLHNVIPMWGEHVQKNWCFLSQQEENDQIKCLNWLFGTKCSYWIDYQGFTSPLLIQLKMNLHQTRWDQYLSTEVVKMALLFHNSNHEWNIRVQVNKAPSRYIPNGE